MANYLTNLVERLGQQAKVVRARPVALFEPQTRTDLLPWVAAWQPTVEAGESVEQPGALEAGERMPDWPGQPAVQVGPRQSQAAVKPRTQVLPAKPGRASGAVEAGEPPQPGYLVHRPASEPDRLPWEPEQRPEPGPAPAGEASLEPGKAPLLQPGVRAHEVRAAPRQTAPFLQSDAAPSIRPDRKDPGKSPRAVPIDLRRATSEDRSLAEPVISVTIGRVEVIAMPPSGPPKAPQPGRKSPVMSLEEYLRSRDQERQL
jgi:hypothetical protein